MSEAQKKRIGPLAARFGSTQTPELKEKLRAANTGRKASLETRTKMSKSQKGRTVTAETRAKMSKAAAKRDPQQYIQMIDTRNKNKLSGVTP